MQSLEDSDNHDDQLLNQKQMRDKALQQAGGVVEIANCFPRPCTSSATRSQTRAGTTSASIAPTTRA